MDKKLLKIGLIILGSMIIIGISMFIYNILNTYYNVTFYNDDNTIIEIKKVKTNNTVLEPLSPKKEGYNFIGWYDGDTKYDFSKKIKNNLNLYAKYEIISDYVFKHIVTFDSNYGSEVPYQTVEHGKTAHMPNSPTKNGYTFIEWRLNNVKYDFNKEVTGDITLVAHWEVAKTKDEINMNKAKEELKDFSISTNNPKLISTLVNGSCSVSFNTENINLNNITRDVEDKKVPIIANITCGEVKSTKQVYVTILKSTYKYIIKENRYLYAYDGENLITGYKLFNDKSSQISTSRKCSDGECISTSVGKLTEGITYYIVLNKNPNIKYALTSK